MIEEAKAQRVAGGSGRNIHIAVEKLSVDSSQASGMDLIWRYSNDRVSVRGGNGLARGGLRMGVADSNFAAAVSAWSRKSARSRRERSEIMVLSGAEGYLWVGRSLIVPRMKLRTPGGEIAVLERARVGAALKVRPQILQNGNIELHLSPHFSVMSGPYAGQNFEVTEMTTTVIVRPGQKLVIGSSSNASRASVARGLFGYSSKGEEQTSVITVTATRL
jgi:type II secretory pathway component GspD/PulD (secretin)